LVVVVVLLDEINRFEKHVRRRRFGSGDPERQVAWRNLESVSELVQTAN
jgi:hypothetical protein